MSSGLENTTDYQPFDTPNGWEATKEAAHGAEPLTCVTFDLLGQIFAVDVRHVREVLDMQTITRLPQASGDLLGMIDVRGEGIAVVDLASSLGLGGIRDIDHGRIIVFELGEGADQLPMGVIADRVLSVVDIAVADLEPAPRTTLQWQQDSVRGITRLSGEIVILLSLDKVFGTATRDPFDFA